jgi:hypothetical protein
MLDGRLSDLVVCVREQLFVLALAIDPCSLHAH